MRWLSARDQVSWAQAGGKTRARESAHVSLGTQRWRRGTTVSGAPGPHPQRYPASRGAQPRRLLRLSGVRSDTHTQTLQTMQGKVHRKQYHIGLMTDPSIKQNPRYLGPAQRTAAGGDSRQAILSWAPGGSGCRQGKSSFPAAPTLARDLSYLSKREREEKNDFSKEAQVPEHSLFALSQGRLCCKTLHQHGFCK